MFVGSRSGSAPSSAPSWVGLARWESPLQVSLEGSNEAAGATELSIVAVALAAAITQTTSLCLCPSVAFERGALALTSGT